MRGSVYLGGLGVAGFALTLLSCAPLRPQTPSDTVSVRYEEPSQKGGGFAVFPLKMSERSDNLVRIREVPAGRYEVTIRTAMVSRKEWPIPVGVEIDAVHVTVWGEGRKAQVDCPLKSGVEVNQGHSSPGGAEIIRVFWENSGWDALGSQWEGPVIDWTSCNEDCPSGSLRPTAAGIAGERGASFEIAAPQEVLIRVKVTPGRPPVPLPPATLFLTRFP